MIAIFSKNIPLIITQSRHYAVPITRVKQLINNLDKEINMSIMITLVDSKENCCIALKFHRQVCSS